MSASSDWVLGVDLGASSLKTSRLVCHNGQVTTIRQPITTHYKQPGHAEQNPQQWLSALQSLLQQYNAIEQPPKAIAISAGAHIAVLLDSNKQPLRPAILWSDQRSSKQAQFLADNHLQHLHDICLNTPSSTWTIAILLWLQQHQPESISKAHHLLFAKDYIRLALTGSIATDPGDATGSMLYDQVNQRWDATLVALAGLSEQQLPEILPSTDIAGYTNAEAENNFSLAQGIPVITGSIDTTSELIAAGAFTPGERVIKLASAGVYSWISNKAACKAPISCYPHILPTLNYFASGTNSCMSSVNWFAETFHHTEGEKLSLQTIDKLAASSNAQDTPLFHPYLLGERAPLWNNQLRAAFSGIGMNHGLADLALALYTGIAYSIRHVIEEASSQCDVAHMSTPIAIIGGGVHSQQLCTILASVLGQPLIALEHSDASIGSAILAAMALGRYNNWQEAQNLLSCHHTIYNTDTTQQHKHETSYRRYLAMITMLDSKPPAIKRELTCTGRQYKE